MTPLRWRVARLEEQQHPTKPAPAAHLRDAERVERTSTLLSRYAEAPDSMSDMDRRRASGLLYLLERVGARAITEDADSGEAILALASDVRARVGDHAA
jgi:hypothetical protein